MDLRMQTFTVRLISAAVLSGWFVVQQRCVVQSTCGGLWCKNSAKCGAVQSGACGAVSSDAYDAVQSRCKTVHVVWCRGCRCSAVQSDAVQSDVVWCDA